MDRLIANPHTRKQLRGCQAAILLLLLFSVWCGFMITISNPQSAVSAVKQTLSQFAFVKNLNLFYIFLFIFLNNTIKGFLVMVMGTFFGLSSIVFIFINGQLLGLVIGVAQFSSSPVNVLWAIAPHGILEIPAIALAASYGLWLGYRTYRTLLYHEEFKIYFSYALRKFATLILPLLFFAALIETFITPLIVSLMAK